MPVFLRVKTRRSSREWKRAAERCRDVSANWDIHRTVCNYDPRDVQPFTGSFLTSFLAEMHLPVARADWTPPVGDEKYDLWCRFKDFYRKRMVERGDYVCRTVPVAGCGLSGAKAPVERRFAAVEGCAVASLPVEGEESSTPNSQPSTLNPQLALCAKEVRND